MHSVREEVNIGERISPNPNSKNRGAQHGYRHQRYNEPYHGNEHGQQNNHRNESDNVPKFLSFLAFCTSPEAPKECQTSAQYTEAYKEYKNRYMTEYVSKMIKLDDTFNRKVVQDRAKTSCILSKWSQRRHLSQKRAGHFLRCFRNRVFQQLNLSAPNFIASNDDVALTGGESAGINRSEITRTLTLDQLATDADIKLPEGCEPMSPLVLEAPYFYLDSSQNTVILRDLPDFISRDDVVEHLKLWSLTNEVAEIEITYDNVDDIEKYWDTLGEQGQQVEAPVLKRSARIQFESKESCDSAMKAMQGRTISVTDADGKTQKYTAHPFELAPVQELSVRILSGAFAHPSVILNDIELSSALINELDNRFGIVHETPILNSVSPDSTYQEKCHQLDVQVTYLAYVHNVDFFGHRMEGSTCNLTRNTAYLALRPCFAELDASVEAELETLKNENEVRLRRHQTAIHQLIEAIKEPFPDPVDEEHSHVKRSWENYIQDNIVPSENGRARCGVCEKLFKGSDFVAKHIANKHYDKLQPVIERVDHELMEQRFVDDKLALYLLPTPRIEQPGAYNDSRAIQQRDGSHQKIVGGPVRRGAAGWESRNNSYRDWDAPTVTIGKQTQSFRKLANYDDL